MGFIGALVTALTSFLFKHFDFILIAILLFKISLSYLIINAIFLQFDQFLNFITQALNNLLDGVGSINGLNLGCVAGLLGADSFLNNLFVTLLFALTLEVQIFANFSGSSLIIS